MPKDAKPQSRTQSRRAASKEAIKQMHILLGDERKYEISSDEDDDVIEVEVQPPKKKYKLSHRKSSDGNGENSPSPHNPSLPPPDRDVIVLKSVNEHLFDLEVVVEDLAPCQKTRRDQLKKETQEIDAKIQELLAAPNADVVYNGVYATALEIGEHVQAIVGAAAAPQPPPPPSIVLQQQTAGAAATLPQSYQLVMDPRLGVIVGAVSGAGAAAPPLQLYQPKKAPEPPMKTRRGTILRQVPSSAIPPLHKVGPKSAVAKAAAATPPTPVKPPVQVKAMAKAAPKAAVQPKAVAPVAQKAIVPVKGKPVSSTATPTPAPAPNANFRPTESNVEGGLSMGTKPQKSIDLTGEDGRALPDSREVSFNKLQGRTYPSLVVVARPHLRVKDLAADRGKLDVKVKSVLMYPPTKFTEWLIQQGLVRSDQKCSVHLTNPLKLGMYSDASKFPYSGGYVWISECCPQRFVSVFSGSLFEGSQHPPMAILKLLYHWCCQTIVQNVTQWVKVDNLYVKGMYTWLRSVCTVALHTHIKKLGGPGVKVQVGVISLGTTSQDGNKREVKVEVLGILETTTRHIRLRAVEPLAEGERNYKKRFTKILEPVYTWVHPESIIVTDLTVDKATLLQMGFKHISQSTSMDYAQSNRTIMEYLRRIVPRMFQNTLSLLSRQIIQQFLDELVWREWYGTSVLQCFDNMIQHLSEQTRFDSGQSLIVRLNKISSNPFKNWSIPLAGAVTTPATPKSAPTTEQATPKRYSRQRKPATPQPPPAVAQEVMRPSKSTSPDVPEQMVPLENYYYGTITLANTNKNKITINIKCPFCKLTFNTNIALMNHLFKHAHNVSNDVQLCKYCLTIVPTGNDLLKHIGTAHPDETKFDNGFVCLICEAHFRNPFILGKHMSKEHCPSELPYLCGTCNFRCSNHKQAVDHFYQQHDHGTTIQCPFCLKSTTIFSGGRNISQNMNYFIQHLQKHQKKQLAKRCGRCTLWFIQKEFLKDHQNKMHISQRGKQGLVPCFAPRNGVMVPKSKMDKCPDDAKIINFSTLYFNVAKNLNCKECDKPLSTPKHFASFESCQNPNCQFSTCCTEAMQEHGAKCKFLNSKLPAQKLPYEMFCICGYSDIYGNMMAKHLAICERKSAYPSKEAAKDATVTHSMLDVLGLVRKPDEATSSKDLLVKRSETPVQPPIILKPRGRPRKNPIVPDANKQSPKPADTKPKDVDEVKINKVKGGDDAKKKKAEAKICGEIDLTENDSGPETEEVAVKNKDEAKKVAKSKAEAKKITKNKDEAKKVAKSKEDEEKKVAKSKEDEGKTDEVIEIDRDSTDEEKTPTDSEEQKEEKNEVADSEEKVESEKEVASSEVDKNISEEKDGEVDKDITEEKVGEVDKDISDEKDSEVDKDISEEKDEVDKDISDEKDGEVDKDISDEKDSEVDKDINDEKDVDADKEDIKEFKEDITEGKDSELDKDISEVDKDISEEKESSSEVTSDVDKDDEIVNKELEESEAASEKTEDNEVVTEEDEVNKTSDEGVRAESQDTEESSEVIKEEQENDEKENGVKEGSEVVRDEDKLDSEEQEEINEKEEVSQEHVESEDETMSEELEESGAVDKEQTLDESDEQEEVISDDKKPEEHVSEVSEEVADNETSSEKIENIDDAAKLLTDVVGESEAMDVDGCNNTDEAVDKIEETVAIENSMEDNTENTEFCPMDTD